MQEPAKQTKATAGAVSAAKGLVRAKPRMGRPPRGKTLLSEERLLKTAIGLIDESGVDALSMRNLAERLSVTAMSLYRYCDNHEALLEAVKREIIEQHAPQPVKNDQSYREALTELAKSLRRAFKAHPKAVVLFSTRPARGTRAIVHLNTVYGRLMEAGFESSIAVYLIDAVTAFTVGLSLAEFAQHSRLPSGAEPPDKQQKPLAKASGLAHEEPLSALGQPNDYETEFIVGLLAIIDGFGSRYAKRAK